MAHGAAAEACRRRGDGWKQRRRETNLRQPHDAFRAAPLGGFVLDDAGHGLLAALELPPAHLLRVRLHLGPSRIARERAAQPFTSGVSRRQHPPPKKYAPPREDRRRSPPPRCPKTRHPLLVALPPAPGGRCDCLATLSLSLASKMAWSTGDELGVAPKISLPQVHVPLVRPVRVLEPRYQVINRILVRLAICS